MKEYKISKGWLIVICVVGLLMIPSFCWLLTIIFHGGDFSPNATWILIPISLFLIAWFFNGFMETYKRRLILTEHEVKLIGWKKTTLLKLTEIKGYTVDGGSLIINPIDSGKDQIKLDNSLGGYKEILGWVDQNFLDLDVEHTKAEHEKILNDETIGFSKEDRAQRLSQAKNVAKLINGAAIISSLWTIFYPRPYELSVLIAIVMPIIAFFILKIWNGLIRMDENKISAYPSIDIALMAPTMAIMLRVIFDYQIFEYINIWIPSIIFASILLLILFFGQKDINFKKTGSERNLLVIVLGVFIYSCSLVVYYNCNYDRSEPQHFKVKIINKEISGGRHRSYYLKLSPWGPQKEIEDVSVGSHLYGRSEIGDSINIYYQKGQLLIPWIRVSD